MNPPKKVPYLKPPLSFPDQIKLFQSRGLVVPDKTKAEFYLSQLNYYRLAAYCLPFEQSHANHHFVAGTTFNEILNLYIFDRELRLLLLDAIERIEVSLRTQLAQYLSINHNSAHPHLDPGLYADAKVYKSSLSKLSFDVKNSNEDFIRHLTSKYREKLPPIWAVVELMTLGQLSRWFSNIKARKDRQSISQIYGVDEKVMTSFCEHLSLVRNCAAHHARLWNRDFTKLMILPRNAPSDLLASLLVLPNQDRKLRKLYNTVVMTAYLMDVINPGHHWKVRLKILVNKHGIEPEKMGFPEDWNKLPMWKNHGELKALWFKCRYSLLGATSI